MGPGASVGLVVLDVTRGVRPGLGPEPGPGSIGGVDDSHLQQPRGPVAVAAAAAAAAVAAAAVLAVSRLLLVSVRVGSVDKEETSLAEAEEDVEGRCCWGLLLTVAPVLWETGESLCSAIECHQSVLPYTLPPMLCLKDPCGVFNH